MKCFYHLGIESIAISLQTPELCLRSKTLHAMIYNPYIEKPVLLDAYSNTDYNKEQYEEYFREVTQFAELIHLVVTAIVIDSQPAQMAGAILYANTLKP